MSDDTTGDTVPRITSAAEWAQAVAWAVHSSAEARSRHIWCVDEDYAEWPLDDRSLLDALTRWLQLPQRRLTLLAAHWQGVPRRHARFTAWRREWSHAIDTLALPVEQRPAWSAALVDNQRIALQLHDRERWRGVATQDPGQAMLLRHEVDALTQRSTPDFPVTQLGL